MKLKKVRFQIFLEEDQRKALERMAKISNSSVGQIIREAVDAYQKSELQEEILTEKDPIWKIAGLFKSKDGDLSIHHDHYLYGVRIKKK